MLYLKKINLVDAQKEYEAVIKIPENENGFENKYFNCSYKDYKDSVIPTLINHSLGIGLPEGYVPSTCYFLWEDDIIIGQVKIRHCLNEKLRKIGGHLGYCILSEYRGKGYATKGLSLAIEECKKIISEDEIYMSVRKDNIASLKVQLKNGARVVDETSDHYLTRIKIR